MCRECFSRAAYKRISYFTFNMLHDSTVINRDQTRSLSRHIFPLRDADNKDGRGWTPLIYALQNGHSDFIKSLILIVLI